MVVTVIMGCPGSSVGKESTCSAGDPGLIPGLGRSTGEGIGYPFQYSWASLVAQLVKTPPAMQETWALKLKTYIITSYNICISNSHILHHKSIQI